MTECAPVIFISHGAPTFALEPGPLGAGLAEIGARLGDLAALLVISPHWRTHGVRVMTTAAPETIHDFRGFPAPLYDIQYPARGHPALAAELVRALAGAGLDVQPDARRGLDHGAWVPLLHLRPAADVPVFQVSMPMDLDAPGALRLGEWLRPWRRRGVMIVGSGSLTHNLDELRLDEEEAPYAREFTRWVRDAVLRGDRASLVGYRGAAPHAQRAHPTEEHFLPLLVALGAVGADDAATVIEGGSTYGVLSMESYAWGLHGAAQAAAHV